MKQLLLSLFILLGCHVYAQKTIMVIPKIDQGASICNSFEIYHNKIALKSIETVYKKMGYNVISSYNIIRGYATSGQCYIGEEKVKNNLITQFGLKYYTEVDVSFHNTNKGSYATVTATVYDTKSQRFLAQATQDSPTEFTSDKGRQITMAFNKIVRPLMSAASTNLKNGPQTVTKKENVNIVTTPPVVITKKEDVKPAKPVKEEPLTVKLPEEEVKEVILPPSDVDINIPQGGRVNEDAVAVVIGNKNYRNKDVPEVSFALRDAATMKKYLMQTYGYREGNIIYVEDATQADFNAIFGIRGNPKGKLYNYIKPNKSDVFIYYSGHGAPNPESNEGYFVPVDTDPSLIQFNGYGVKTLYDNLEQMPFKSLTVVMDACFSGSSDGGMLLKSISPVFIKTKSKVLEGDNSVIMTATASEQVASWYNEKGHGLFTYFYLKGLQGAADLNKNGQITIDEMSEYITENVQYMARRLNNREQVPQISAKSNTRIK
ncbi:caspase family protein [Flammeovirga sp. MY04]|uniref:caspase family protein n=1 Tax=Flammeovirga sp. MY04 TaxID=1191459 RepID=UPI00080609B3|nr:caspase family protein [Flammeovirga sp. MY04]ANQ47601.1 caspase family protein [Flammeovirga sp. MY04]